VFEPQASGTSQFVELLGEQELDFALIVTANTGLLGGTGLAPTVATTRFIQALAHTQHRSNDWPWITVSLDVERLRFASARVPARDDDPLGLMPEAVIEVFHRALATESASGLIVSTVNLHTRLSQAASYQTDQKGSGLSEPATTTRWTTRTYVPPQTGIEETLVSIWQQLLGIEQVGIFDDFFELGGHSLLATQVIAQIQERLGVRVSIQQMFEYPTITLLAAAIDPQAARDTTEQATMNDLHAPITAAPRDRYRMKRTAAARQSSSQQKPHDQQ
jgi:acyl carrier protein